MEDITHFLQAMRQAAAFYERSPDGQHDVLAAACIRAVIGLRETWGEHGRGLAAECQIAGLSKDVSEEIASGLVAILQQVPLK